MTSLMKITAVAVLVNAALVVTTGAQNTPDILWKTNADHYVVAAVAISANGGLLASGTLSAGGRGYIRLWQVTNMTVVNTIELPHEDVLALAYSPDGNYLVSGGWKSESGGTIRLWSGENGTPLQEGIGGDSITSVAFSADSILLGQLSRSGNQLVLLNVPAWTVAGSSDDPPPGDGSCVTFSPTAKVVATGGMDGSVTLWSYTNELSDHTILATYGGQASRVTDISFLPDGSRLVSSSEDGTIVIRRASDGTIERTIRDSAPVRSTAVSPDGKTLLSRSDLIKYWRVSDGSLLLTYDDDPFQVASLVISPTGKFFAYGKYNGTLVVARMPLWIEQITRNGNEVTLHWQGGSGLYQLQARNDLSTGQWQDIGNPTTNNVITHSCLSPTFFRVQSLPNP